MMSLSHKDKEAIRKARETVKKHKFSGSDYQRIETRKQAETTRQDNAYISKTGKVFYDNPEDVNTERDTAFDAAFKAFESGSGRYEH